MKRTMRWTSCLGLVGLLLAGCAQKDGGSAATDDKITVGMMPKLIGIDFFNACERGAEEAAAELGVELVWDGPIVNDVTKQAEMLDTWIIRRLDAITVAPNDPHALAPTLRKARERGIKVLTWDADSEPDSRDDFVNQATFASVAYALVDVMARQIDNAGEVAIVTGSLTAANQNVWMEHMRERMADKYPEMNLVTVKPSEEDQQLAFQVTQDLLKAYPDLEGIFAITSVALPGAAQALREAGAADRVALTGLSTPNSMRPYIKDGTLKEFVLWNPVDLGYLTVYAAKTLVENGTLPATLDAGRLGPIEVRDDMVLLGEPIVFNAGNIDQFDF